MKHQRGYLRDAKDKYQVRRLDRGIVEAKCLGQDRKTGVYQGRVLYRY